MCLPNYLEDLAINFDNNNKGTSTSLLLYYQVFKAKELPLKHSFTNLMSTSSGRIGVKIWSIK